MYEVIQQLFLSVLQGSIFFGPFIFIPVIIITIVVIKTNKDYKNSTYYKITNLPYFSVRFDIGKYGEYLTYKYLKHFETNGARFLFNIYIPKVNGETTEIDVLMICPKGIFVLESKNYSGWIFGSETQKYWYQTLPKGRGKSHKESFYNPILQNRSHIKHLKALLDDKVPMRSIIVFSDRCTLKNVQIKSNDVSVINRYNVYQVITAICNQIPTNLLSEGDIINIYNKLHPYTQVDCATKAQHIANINNNLNARQSQQTPPSVLPTVQTEYNQTSAIEEPNVLHTQANKSEASVDTVQPKTITQQGGEKPQNLKCPKCNGSLVLRTAKKGANAGKRFYGCSNYPKCKYIEDIK